MRDCSMALSFFEHGNPDSSKAKKHAIALLSVQFYFFGLSCGTPLLFSSH